MSLTAESSHEWFEVECTRIDFDARRSVIARFALKAVDEEMAIGLVDQHLSEDIYHVSLGDWKPKTMAEVYALPDAGHAYVRPLESGLSSLYDNAHGDHVRLISYEEKQSTD